MANKNTSIQLIELYLLNKIVLFTILHFTISVSIRLIFAYLKQFTAESSDFWKQLFWNNFSLAHGRTRPRPPSNYIATQKTRRVSPRTSKKLFLPVVQVVSNLNIQTFQHSNINPLPVRLRLSGGVMWVRSEGRSRRKRGNMWSQRYESRWRA